MTCYIHPEREAEWTCAVCGQSVCPECKVTLQGRVYCNPCAEKMYLAALNRPSWFEKHLNWTMAIGFFTWAILTLVGSIILFMLSPEVTEETLGFEAQLLGNFTLFLIQFPIARWVIRKKQRNPWNILWLLAPVGFVMIILLSNSGKTPQNNPVNPRTL